MESAEQSYFIKLTKQFLVAGVFGLVLMTTSMIDLLPDLATDRASIFWILISLLSLIIMIYSGRHFYTGAWQALKNHHATMDTLVAIGTGSAWIYSTAIAITPQYFLVGSHHVYFESAAIIIALINLGSALETKARNKTSVAIKKLLQLQPRSARIIRGDQEINIPIEQIQIGNHLRIRPGENIPVDGFVTEGESHLDESMLTGESIPVLKSPGSRVSTGTTNFDGAFIMQASAIGEQTVLSQIVAMVRQAQYTKPRIGKLTDKVTSVFVPTVLIIAILTALIWYNFGNPPILPTILTTTTAVLLIACPCALGLATPISIIGGIGKAAEYGILIRSGEALQRATEITTLVFDKTGTLTEGHPQVVKVYAAEGVERDTVLKIAASIEQHSEHPWANAIVQAANSNNLVRIPTEKFTAISGKGVQARIKDEVIAIGNITLMHEREVDLSSMHSVIEKCNSNAYTPTFVSQGRKLLGIIALADPIKPSAYNIFAQLKNSKIKVILLTGDNQKTAQSVANELGIKTVIAEVLPEQKAQKIMHLQQRGEVVGMVGDGINDASALAQADVGFALSSGTDIAIASSDITLLGENLQGVINAMQLSKYSMRNIRQNLWGAFLYNSLSIPIAAGLLYPRYGIVLSPMIAAAAMAASSLTVVLNANRLRHIMLARTPT